MGIYWEVLKLTIIHILNLLSFKIALRIGLLFTLQHY